MTEAKTRPCPSCGGAMRRADREETVSYKGEFLTYLQPGWYCETGDDGILEGPDNDYHDAALHEVMARAKHSPISPLVVRAARDAVGVSQREAGRVFGGGPTAFYKYETAKSVPSESMANLLRLALEHPELIRRPARGGLNVPTPEEVELVRKTSRDDRLNTIMRSIYPQTARSGDVAA